MTGSALVEADLPELPDVFVDENNESLFVRSFRDTNFRMVSFWRPLSHLLVPALKNTQ